MRSTVQALAVALCVSGCSPKAANHPVAAPRPSPRIDATLALPQGDGRVHVIAIPGELEVTRCIVAISPTGAVATSCAPKEIELPAGES
jgi:hypothetical protein